MTVLPFAENSGVATLESKSNPSRDTRSSSLIFSRKSECRAPYLENREMRGTPWF